MTRSIEYIDFSIENLIKESVLICYYTKGGFNFETIKELPFKDYEILLKEVERIQEESNKEEDELNG